MSKFRGCPLHFFAPKSQCSELCEEVRGFTGEYHEHADASDHCYPTAGSRWRWLLRARALVLGHWHVHHPTAGICVAFPKTAFTFSSADREVFNLSLKNGGHNIPQGLTEPPVVIQSQYTSDRTGCCSIRIRHTSRFGQSSSPWLSPCPQPENLTPFWVKQLEIANGSTARAGKKPKQARRNAFARRGCAERASCGVRREIRRPIPTLGIQSSLIPTPTARPPVSALRVQLCTEPLVVKQDIKENRQFKGKKTRQSSRRTFPASDRWRSATTGTEAPGPVPSTAKPPHHYARADRAGAAWRRSQASAAQTRDLLQSFNGVTKGLERGP